MSMTRQEVLRALADGKEVEITATENTAGAGWIEYDLDKNDRARILGKSNFGGFLWRLKPTPRTAPLGPEDVPPGSVVRCPNHMAGSWLMVVGVDPRFIAFQEGETPLTETWGNLSEERWEISRDGGKTWHRCEKEVAE